MPYFFQFGLKIASLFLSVKLRRSTGGSGSFTAVRYTSSLLMLHNYCHSLYLVVVVCCGGGPLVGDGR